MMRISEPGDIGRVLRFAGRLGHQAGVGAAGLRDVADVVRALAISLVLDVHGGWISVRETCAACGHGIEVLAFDLPTGGSGEPRPLPWPHLRARLEQLGPLGAAVSVGHTPGGGTAVWTRIAQRPAGEPGARDRTGSARPATLDLTGLLQTPLGEMSSGWRAVRHGDHLGIVICEAPPGESSGAVAQRLLREPHPQVLEQFLRLVGEGAAALVDVDLANRTVRTQGSGIALTLVADGRPASDEGTLRWERSLSLLAHTAGIRPRPHGPTDAWPAPLIAATLMREHREATATACVVVAHVEAPS